MKFVSHRLSLLDFSMNAEAEFILFPPTQKSR